MEKDMIDAPPQSSTPKRVEPTQKERESLDALQAERKRRKPAPSLKLKDGPEDDGRPHIVAAHDDVNLGHNLIMAAIGALDDDFYSGFLSQITNATAFNNKADAIGMNFVLSVVKGIEPRDQMEAMLAAHMAAVHMAAMTYSRKLGCTTSP